MSWLRRIFLFPLLLTAVPAWSQGLGDDGCAPHFAAAEASWGIPQGLLAAIAQVESANWPWTINADGESHRYTDQAQAENAANQLRAGGLRSLDVGCMQINLAYHPQAFATLSEAFDPAHNVGYAARFLASLHRMAGNWEQAVARYHSATPGLGEEYLRLVQTARLQPNALPLGPVHVGWVSATWTVQVSHGIHIWRPIGTASNAVSTGKGHLIIIKNGHVARS